MKVYLAAPWGSRAAMRQHARQLISEGFEIVSGWIYLEGDNTIGTSDGRMEAITDFMEVKRCDALIHFSDTAEAHSVGGKSVEQGLAMAWGKVVIHVGPVENIFHQHPLVHCVPDFEAVITLLTRGRQSVEDSYHLANR